MKKLVIVLLLLVACQIAQRPAKQPAPPEIFTGTSALELSFAPISMSDVMMCRQADVFVNFRNTGAFDIKDGVYSFIVEDQVLRPVGERQKKFSLEGKSQFVPPGGFEQVAFKFQSVGLPEQLESYFSPVILQACYKYKTFASAPVCIDPDLQNLNPRKPCRSEIVGLAGGQGAPVAVTRVEPIMETVPNSDKVRPVFVVHLNNFGTGQAIIEKNVELACSAGREKVKDLLVSLVDVKARLQGKELMCVQNPVRLVPGEEAFVHCESDALAFGLATGTFSTVLEVELSYGYVNSAVWPLTISRLPGQGKCP